MKKIFLFIALTGLFVSCKNDSKKIIVMSKGEPVINTDAKTITSTDGAGHTEKTFIVGGGDHSFTLSTPAGEGTVDMKESGLYVVNAKLDTIIGSYQHYTEASKANATITQEDLAHRIDSLHLLLEGKNISAANRNFYILPKTGVKISDNIESHVVGPYHQMTSVAKVDGKEPEVYRFYSIKEIREIVTRLEALTVAGKN